MSTTHTSPTTGHLPGLPAARCAAVLCHSRLQLVWDPASGTHRLAITQAPRVLAHQFATAA